MPRIEVLRRHICVDPGIREIALVCVAALAYFGIRHPSEGQAVAAFSHARRKMRLYDRSDAVRPALTPGGEG